MMQKPKDNKHPKLYFAFSFAPRQSFQKLLFAKGQTIGCLSEAARFVSSQQDLTKLTLHSALASIHITKVIAKSLDSKVLSF